MPSLELNSVSESHMWSDINDYPSANPTGNDTVPVIDLTTPDAARLVGLACESWGVFQVVGHGVSDHIVEKLNYQARRFFALPTEEKMKVVKAPGSTDGYGSVPSSSFFSKQLWLEGLSIRRSPCDLVSEIWPEDLSFSNVVEEYRKDMEVLCRKLLTLMLQSLGLAEGNIARVDPIGLTQKELIHPLQLNWYPPCPEPDRAMGMAPHTDSTVLAVLLCDGSGLQVLRDADTHSPTRWVTIPPLSGAFVINVGDLGHILSNGRFRNVIHRAVVNRERSRLSAVYFWYPPDNVRISPIVRCTDYGPVYRGVTWPELKEIRSKIFDKALSSIKLVEEKVEKDSSQAPCVKEKAV